MYFPYFITYMVVGFVISVAVFVWALKAGQFKDQQRARFLPLEGQPDHGPLKVTRYSRIHTIVLFAIACTGVVSTAVVLAYTLLTSG
jgi:cbb3-type cytochrome oxidase maturation protein